MAEQVPFYDTSRWKSLVVDHASIQAFTAQPLPTDAIVRIGEGLGKVEFKINLPTDITQARSTHFLVGFSGAITTRSSVSAPLFSGISLSHDLGLPLLAFADPVVSASPDLTLAWYAGGDGGFGLPKDMARIIDHCAAITGAMPILIGGSGGGFAVMNTMQHMVHPARGLVWNPQTSICDYVPMFVRKYINFALPQADQTLTCRQILDTAGVSHDVRSAGFGAQSFLIYLQNESDPHIKTHMQPLIDRAGDWQADGPRTLRSEDRGIIVQIGNWAYGHAVPSRGIIEAVIGLLVRTGNRPHSLQGVAGQLSGILSAHINEPIHHNVDFTANAMLVDDEVRINVQLPDPDAGITFAYYLLVDGIRVSTQWYTDKASTFFVTDVANPDRLRVTVFAKPAVDAKPTIRTIPVLSAL